jgi:5-methylcytosine-specific restriction endonuclease McrA
MFKIINKILKNVRNRNTNEKGEAWTRNEIDQVWRKGIIVANYSPDVWRLDRGGIMMNFFEHGNKNSQYGWEIDHINPVSNGGKDNLENLQPLNWVNNLEKEDQLNWSCSQNKYNKKTQYNNNLSEYTIRVGI